MSCLLSTDNTTVRIFILCWLSFGIGSVANAQDRDGGVPTGVEFKRETLKRIGAKGDNWCITWTASGDQVVSMDDGDWLKPSLTYSNHLYRVIGEADDFKRADIAEYPNFKFGEKGWFGYGILSVDGALYSCVSKCAGDSWSGPFRGVKLLKSPKDDPKWYRVGAAGESKWLDPESNIRNSIVEDEFFFFEMSGREKYDGTAYPFSFCSFAQCGRDNSAARDNFIYIYSPEGSSSNELLLARVEKNQFERRDAWEFFSGRENGQLTWGKLEERKPVVEFPATNSKGECFGWYSWLPSVVWNEGLQMFVMVNGGTYAGHGLTNSKKDYYDNWMHTKSGSLGLWYAKDPWGPWKQFYYDEEWVVDDPKNRTYQPKLSPKWISEDGKTMTLIWSDAMKNENGHSHTTNYLWNQMQIEIQISEVSQ
jgi:hypothetical protein